jgi:hypothetical protein
MRSLLFLGTYNHIIKMKANKELTKGGLATLATALFLNSGACVEPYAYVVTDRPARVVAVPPPTHTRYVPVRAECHTYAASAADSMSANGDRVSVCTPNSPHPPRVIVHSAPDYSPQFDFTRAVRNLDNILNSESCIKKGCGRTMFDAEIHHPNAVTVTSFTLDKDPKNPYLLVCIFSGDIDDDNPLGSCIIDGGQFEDKPKKGVDGKADAAYSGPLKHEKHNILECLKERRKKGFAPGCMPLKHLGSYEKAQANMNYHSLVQHEHPMRQKIRLKKKFF